MKHCMPATYVAPVLDHTLHMEILVIWKRRRLKYDCETAAHPDSFKYWRGLGSITQQYANSRSRLRMSTGDTFSCTNDWVKISGTLSLLYVVD